LLSRYAQYVIVSTGQDAPESVTSIASLMAKLVNENNPPVFLTSDALYQSNGPILCSLSLARRVAARRDGGATHC